MFIPRSNAPAYNNKFYVNQKYGGYNLCIIINKNTGSVLANCTGYAYGRFMEETGKTYCNLPRTNACTWFNANHGYETGLTARKGAVLCYSGGWENRGHVSIVEEVYSDGSILVSQSNYGGILWEQVKLTYPNYNQGYNLHFQGFIYNPEVDDQPSPSSKIKMHGIDISQHNGYDLNIDDYDFVIIRACWGTNQDSKADTWRRLCEEKKIPYGVYMYTYALSEQDAIDEANYILDMVKYWNIQVGIWLDMENDSYKQERGAFIPELCSLVCRTFCTKIQEAGYYTGIYASESVFGTYIKGCDMFDKWVASWGTNNGTIQRDTSDMGTILQYTSKGGINGSPLDCDVSYVDLEHYKSYPVNKPFEDPIEDKPVIDIDDGGGNMDDKPQIVIPDDDYLFKMSDKMYDFLNFLVHIIPRFLLLYIALANAWDWKLTIPIIATVEAVVDFISSVVKQSKIGYERTKRGGV